MQNTCSVEFFPTERYSKHVFWWMNFIQKQFSCTKKMKGLKFLRKFLSQSRYADSKKNTETPIFNF